MNEYQIKGMNNLVDNELVPWLKRKRLMSSELEVIGAILLKKYEGKYAEGEEMSKKMMNTIHDAEALLKLIEEEEDIEIEPKLKTKTYNVVTSMGKHVNGLHCLNVDEMKEFNNIGYTGKDSNGNRSSYELYLNTLNKGDFTVKLIKGDNGDFTEEYVIFHVIKE